MKNIIKKSFELLGLEIRKKRTEDSLLWPIGRMDYVLEGLKNRGLNSKCIMDIGANIGGWSRMAKNIFPHSYFVLIEPQVEMQNDLELFCMEHPSSQYFLVGVGSKQESLTLTIWDDLMGSSFLPDSNQNLKESGKQRVVEITTIDNLIVSNNFPVPDIIKMDIQGFELEALKGAEQTFGSTEVYILEVSLFNFSEGKEMPVFSDIVNFMLERDYVVYDFAGFLRRPYDNALGQCDICFVKKNGFLRKSNKWSSK